MPKISVIIPTYNCAQYIAEAIESVLNQAFKDIEIIVVDDGSTDNTREILNLYIEKNIIKYIFQENKGPGAARNAGIKASGGRFLAFLDADDILLPKSLERKVEFLEKNRGVYLVFSDYFKQNDFDSLPKVGFLKERNLLNIFNSAIEKREDDEIVFNHKKYFEIAIKDYVYIHTCGVLLRRVLIDRIGLFRTDFSIGEDNEFWFRICNQYDIGYIDKPLYLYRTYASNLTKNKLKFSENAIKYYDFMLKSYGTNGSIKKALNKRLSDQHFWLGYCYMDNNMRRRALGQFVRSILSDPFNTASWKYGVLGLMPKALSSFVKANLLSKR